jgi:hypothetical protein
MAASGWRWSEPAMAKYAMHRRIHPATVGRDKAGMRMVAA